MGTASPTRRAAISRSEFALARGPARNLPEKDRIANACDLPRQIDMQLSWYRSHRMAMRCEVLIGYAVGWGSIQFEWACRRSHTEDWQPQADPLL